MFLLLYPSSSLSISGEFLLWARTVPLRLCLCSESAAPVMQSLNNCQVSTLSTDFNSCTILISKTHNQSIITLWFHFAHCHEWHEWPVKWHLVPNHQLRTISYEQSVMDPQGPLVVLGPRQQCMIRRGTTWLTQPRRLVSQLTEEQKGGSIS